MREKQYNDDDGRTVADMSGVERPSMFRIRSLKKHGTFAENEAESNKPQLSSEQRKSYLGGALSAALVVALVFIVAGAILIALLTAIWH